MAAAIKHLKINLLTATAAELQTCLRSGQVSSVDLVHAYRQQIKRYDGHLHAMLDLAPEDKVLEQARLRDQERADGKLKSKLHGIPIIVKDNIATSPELGMRTTAGNLALAKSVVKENAAAVDLLIKAGLIIIGKASLSEMSNFKGEGMPGGWCAVGGQAQSAYMKDGLREGEGMYGQSSPAGSSAGSCIAVSAGYAPFSLGSETSGSLVAPGNRAALYTLRTNGRIPGKGVVPISSTLDQVGPLTKNVEDLVDLFHVLTDGQAFDYQQLSDALQAQWKDLSVGTVDAEFWTKFPTGSPPDPKCKEQIVREIGGAYEEIKHIAKAYHHHVELPPAENHYIDGKPSSWRFMGLEFEKDLNTYLAGLESTPVETLKDLVKWNKEHSDLEMPPGKGNQSLLEAAAERNPSKEETEELRTFMLRTADTEGLAPVFDKYAFDVLLGPADSDLYDYATTARYPCCTMPLGQLDDRGRPFGLIAIARPGGEKDLIRVMSAWEKIFPARAVPDMDALPV